MTFLNIKHATHELKVNVVEREEKKKRKKKNIKTYLLHQWY